LHRVGFFMWTILWCTDPRTPNIQHWYLHNPVSLKNQNSWDEVWGLRFLQWCSWGFKSSRMWHCVNGLENQLPSDTPSHPSKLKFSGRMVSGLEGGWSIIDQFIIVVCASRYGCDIVREDECFEHCPGATNLTDVPFKCSVEICWPWTMCLVPLSLFFFRLWSNVKDTVLIPSQYHYTVFVRGSVHHTTIRKKNPTRCNNVSKFLLFRVYMKLNMFRATHCQSSGA
jgi:hypothetical protein